MQPRCTAFLMVVAALLAVGACRAQAPRGLPDALLAEVRTPADVPAGKYTAAQTWKAEATGHRIGRSVDDPEAEGGKAWEVKPEVDPAETALFGPYIEIAPGDYVAFFRLKLLETPEDDLAATLDACVSYGQDMLAARDLGGPDLTVGRYVQVPLGFHYPGGKLECRLNWTAAAGLRIDRVSLFRVEGAEPSKLEWRVPPAVPSGKPNNLPYYTEPRPFPDIFPRSAPPARQLVVCDLAKERTDTRMLIYSLQGLVNRAQPRLYCLSVTGDPFWLEQMQKRGWIESTDVVARPLDLLTRFRDSFKGIIITDPNLPASKNVATMLASVKNGLVASPRLAKQLGLPVLDDLRGRWATSAQAYRWAFDNLWDRLNHHVLACAWPDHLALRDYLVENKVFIFWLSGPIDGAHKYASPDAEARLMEQLFARMPANIPLMSYSSAGKDVGIGEGPGVTLFAEFGKYLVGSIDTSNLSVHSGIPVPQLRQAPPPPAPKLDDSKVYLSWLISDGDNLPVLTLYNFPQLWQEKTRGKFPIGWTMSPSAGMLIPDVVDYYYRTATPNDHFMAAVSGIGYTYPDVYGKRFRDRDRQKVFDEFLAQTATYMQRCDQKILWVCGATRPELFSRYAEKIPFLEALFPDYGRRVPSANDATYPTARNVPVFCAVTGWREDATREQRLAQLVADLRRMTPAQKPAFLQAFVLNWFCDLAMLDEALQQLGPDYVCVRPDHLAQLWHEDMRRRQVTVRLMPVACCIEGQSLKLRGTVRNVSDRPLDVDARLVEGLDGGKVAPARMRLVPEQETAFVLTGRPAGDRLTLEVTGDFGARQVQVALRRIPVSTLAGPLPEGGTLVPATFLEGEDLNHRSGDAQADPAASGGSAWVATRGKTRPDCIVFGPYSTLDAGRYLALFGLKRLDEGAGVLALLDTCVGGGIPQTGKLEVRAEDLPVGQYRWVPIIFDHPGGQYETRVNWSGVASLAVDAVPVWRIEPR